ncbi:MAG: DUF1080 domain-containing protein [Tannerella sp.]|jgi:hypothetical protein|nr:DUF1080 domain-containing protein [Tannerella sp.]
MRRIFLSISSALLLCGSILMAQGPANRTVQTTIADALAQLPAEKQASYNNLMNDLCSTGEEGVLILVKQLNAPGKGSNAQVEYALSGMSHYAAGEGRTAVRTQLENAYLKALEQTDVPEISSFIISQLAICGTDAAIEKLAPRLNDEKISGPAARAIASIGGEKAGKTLLASLLRRSGTPNTQRDVILALANVPTDGVETILQGMLASDDADTKAVVFYTLSRIGTKASLSNLAAAAEKAGFTLEKSGANEAYIRLIERVYAQGDTKEAEKAANDLLKKSTKAGKTGTRIAALKLLLSSAPGEKASKMVTEALKDPSIEYRNAALTAASDFADEKLYVTLLKSINKAKPELQTDILNWIGREAAQNPTKQALLNTVETGIEVTAVQTITSYLNNSDFGVKQAATWALVRIGNTQSISSVASLLENKDPQAITLGQNALAVFKGDISPAVAKVAASAPDKGKIAAVELLALRKATGYLNSVLDLIKSGSPEVKTAAYKALKDVVGEKDQTNMCGMLESADKSAIAPLQQAVIATLASQSPAQKVETITRRIFQAGENKKHLYYLPLATTGDSKALELIVSGFAKEKGDTKDAAFEALLRWNGFEAAEELYQISKDPSAASYFDRALTAYIKIVSNPGLTGENRLIYLRKAMEIAKTDAQKNTILSQIGRTGTYLALLYAGNYVDNSALKENAAVAVMTIALNHPEYTGENVVALLNKAGAALSNPDADYQRQSIRKHLDEAPKEKGFEPVFNGKDLTGWKGLVANPILRAKMKPAQLVKEQEKADQQMRKDWKVEKGELLFDGTGYDNLCTEKQYGDFEMYVDWKLDPAGPEADAGIYLRGTPQVQIWDTSRVKVGAQVGSGGLYNNQVNNSKPLKVADNKLGEWNTLYIKMVGDRVTVKLNGELVVDDVILENYWDRKLPIPPVEQIELQAHGSKVYYRNIYIKELERPEPFQLSAEEKKEGYRILFDGTNMYDWTGNLVDYTLEDGSIAMNPSKNFGGNLYTKEEFANFDFRFEFQLTPAANNGLGIRAPLEGDAAYVGMELQILDSEHPVYKDLHEYQYHGSVYGIIPAKRGFLKPVGEWNYQEVIADGNHIKVILNGTVILDGDIKEATQNGTPDKQKHPGLFNKTGHIGFLGHGSPVKFRNIRIKELK